MQKTAIEWVKNQDGTPGYTLNLLTGCRNCTLNGLCKSGMFPCYAWKLANTRLKELYVNNRNFYSPSPYFYNYKANMLPFYPRLWENKFKPVTGKGKGIFLNDMSDWMGIGVPEKWTNRVIDFIKFNSRHRFYTLTKQPENLLDYSPFPENCWVGVTATTSDYYEIAFRRLNEIEASVKFLSLEPLVDWTHTVGLEHTLRDIQWAIIGACTGTRSDMETLCKRYPDLTIMPWGNRWTAQPRIEWLKEIVEACDKVGVKVFLKYNLEPLIKPGILYLRQEIP